MNLILSILDLYTSSVTCKLKLYPCLEIRGILKRITFLFFEVKSHPLCSLFSVIAGLHKSHRPAFRTLVTAEKRSFCNHSPSPLSAVFLCVDLV